MINIEFDDLSADGKCIYGYTCSGEHEGPPVKVEITNPRPEYDECGTNMDYDEFKWFNFEGVHPDVLDKYEEAVREDVMKSFEL